MSKLSLVGMVLMLAFMKASSAGEDMQSRNRDDWPAEREAMVGTLRVYGIKDARVLAAMRKIRRHMFIPENYRNRRDAYGDYPCPIGQGQT
ncbi:MAG: protein-L-isoaspartate O-methyltransferase, partial [Kiritimatiellae bacterium]|nr:protein-L-isoaspartate O-methyltransferase [Kiritimatiellia bacterium]